MYTRFGSLWEFSFFKHPGTISSTGYFERISESAIARGEHRSLSPSRMFRLRRENARQNRSSFLRES